ncbi:hypothetical protein C8J31_105176 [Rhizobium sp. PP-CC-2G-626]|nr:hypothetical protein C8J31_105176 [Rhizobium sp. PP-CC-2G-626]
MVRRVVPRAPDRRADNHARESAVEMRAVRTRRWKLPRWVVKWKMTSSSASFGGFSRSPAVLKKIPSALPDGASGSHGAACRRLARFHRTTAVSTVAASSMTSPRRDPFEVHDGQPFHEPGDKDLRKILNPGTGPASPERLPVHPITGRGKYGGGNVGGEKKDQFFLTGGPECLSAGYRNIPFLLLQLPYFPSLAIATIHPYGRRHVP